LLFTIFPRAIGAYILFAENGSSIVQDFLSILDLYRWKEFEKKKLLLCGID
jgi:hypothetical protein